MTNEEFTKRTIRHGELLLVAVDEIPADAVQILKGNSYIAAHSETGHNHILNGNLAVFESKGLENPFYVKMFKSGSLEHAKTFEKHETKTVFKGLYQVVLKKSYDYFAKKMTRVVD